LLRERDDVNMPGVQVEDYVAIPWDDSRWH
jgi:hypothetical protein